MTSGLQVMFGATGGIIASVTYRQQVRVVARTRLS